MKPKVNTYQVVIVGGGPVGLFLGICLNQAGISCLILEKQTEAHNGSRSLGIHPVSLELFKELEIAKPFVRAGIKISKGHAFTNSQKLGSLSFDQCPKPFNYILSLPQHRTEELLETELKKRNPDMLLRGAEVTGFSQQEDAIEVSYKINEKAYTSTASHLVGCDGKNSFVRKIACIPFEGKTYPDTYIMGDFSDNTDFGSDAAIFLCEEGLIESFPLLNNRRRWVIKTKKYFPSINRRDIEHRVQQRIGYDLTDTENVMLSSFGVQKLVANPMVKDRVILAGDAAHVVSPIGGQGMNLGWLGAWDLAQTLQQIANNNRWRSTALHAFEKRRTKAASNAIRRAELNMRLGRETRRPMLRNGLVSLMLRPPLAQLAAKTFTMRGVEHWPF